MVNLLSSTCLKSNSLAIVFALSLASAAPNAVANPVDGTVTAGSATISGQDKKLDVFQHTDKAVIDWRGFDIEVDEHTQFHQPSSSSLVLNRVNSANPSNIAGKLSANGNVMIVNPNGVVFGKSSQIDVSGLIATTADIDNADFMAGNMVFDKPGRSNASIINNGNITAKQAGLVGFVAPNVENNGVIRAKLGKVQLASGDSFTLDMYGDGLIEVEASDAITKQVVHQRGVIDAEGGDILITAAAAKESVDSLLNISGTLDTGGFSTDKAGNIIITGDTINVAKSAKIRATGKRAGGDVKIGGDFAGKGNIQTADNTTVADGAHIDVSATEHGDAGTAVVWADNHTEFHGTIDAKGGTHGGDGGFVEVSGKNTLTFSGFVDRNAPKGEAGMLLLDPTDINISTAPDAANNVNTTTLVTNLGGGPVTIDTFAAGADVGDITVSNAITWASGNDLTLQASNDITINADITGSGAGTNLILDAGNDGAGDITINNRVALSDDSTFTARGGNITVGAAGVSSGRHLTLIADTMSINGTVDTGVSRTLTIRTSTNGTTMGLGTGAAGTLSFDDAELGLLADASSRITFETTDGTVGNGADIDIHNLNIDRDFVTIDSGVGSLTIDAGGVSAHAGTTLTTLYSDDFAINGALAGSTTISFHNATRYNSLGIGTGTAGANNFTDTELGNLTDGWDGIQFHSTDGNIEVSAQTWSDDVFINSALGDVTISGAQDAGANELRLGSRRDIVINDSLSGTGTLILTAHGSSGENVFIGDDAGGAGMHVSDASLLQIQDGWSEIIFTDQSLGSLTYDPSAAITWSDPIRFRAGDDVNINDAINVLAGSDATVTLSGHSTNTADNINVNVAIDTSAIDGGGAVLFEEAAQVNLNNNVTTGGGDITIADTVVTTVLGSAVTLMANEDFSDSETGGTLSIGTGGINAGANNLTLYGGDITVNGALTGTAILEFGSIGTGETIGIGTGAGGAYQLDDGELANITDGWNSIVIAGNIPGPISNVAMNAATWNDDVRIGGQVGTTLTINGAQNFGANDFTIDSGTTTVAFNAPIIGTGNLAFSLLRFGDNVASTQVSDASLANIQDGWNEIRFRGLGGSAMTVDTAGTWTIADPLVIGANTTLNLNSDIAAAAGSNASIQFYGGSNNVDDANLNGDIDLSAAGAGFGDIIIDNGIANLNLGGSLTTNNRDITFANTGTRTLTGSSIIDAGSGTITIDAGGFSLGFTGWTLRAEDYVIGGNITGSSTLLFDVNNNESIGLGDGQAGTAHLSDAELDFIQDGFSVLQFGHTNGAVTVGARTWLDDVTFASFGSSVHITGDQNSGANDLSISGDTILDANVIGTGTVYFSQLDAVGDDAAGARKLDDTELARITDGWGTVQFSGSPLLTVDTAGYEFTDPTVFIGRDYQATTSVTINDNLTAAAGSNASFTFSGNANSATRNLDTVTINGNIDTSAATSNGGITFTNFVDTVNLNGNLVTNNADITITNDVTNFNTTGNSVFNAGTGSIAIGSSGINAAANDLQLIANEMTLNGDLDGTGNLIIQPSNNATTISLNDGNVTGLDFSAAELARIGATTDFATVTIGSAAHTGALNAGDWAAGSQVFLRGGSIDLDGNVNTGANTLNIFANTGNITRTSGTLTADTLNLDSPGMITADVNVTTALDIANNSTATTLTGVFSGGNTQVEADLITGGPGNDTNYTFEGFTIRAVAAPPPPVTPPSTPTVDDVPVVEVPVVEVPVVEVPVVEVPVVGVPTVEVPDNSDQLVDLSGLPTSVEQITAYPVLTSGTASYGGSPISAIQGQELITSSSESSFYVTPENQPYEFEPTAYSFTFMEIVEPAVSLDVSVEVEAQDGMQSGDNVDHLVEKH